MSLLPTISSHYTHVALICNGCRNMIHLHVCFHYSIQQMTIFCQVNQSKELGLAGWHFVEQFSDCFVLIMHSLSLFKFDLCLFAFNIKFAIIFNRHLNLSFWSFIYFKAKLHLLILCPFFIIILFFPILLLFFISRSKIDAFNVQSNRNNNDKDKANNRSI